MGMHRFVILEHDHPSLHWDLMLEADGALQTWRLNEPPRRAGQVIAATPLPSHRLAYLDYEGPVSGNRGTVRRWDHGTFEMLNATTYRLEGESAHWLATLTESDDATTWTFEACTSPVADTVSHDLQMP